MEMQSFNTRLAGPVSALIFGGAALDVVGSFVYLGSYSTVGRCIEDVIIGRIAKNRLAFASFRQFWRRHDIHLSLKGQIYYAFLRVVLLYSCDAWGV